MSKGSQVITFRLVPELVEELDEYLRDRNKRHPRENLTRSQFIISCIQFKMEHLVRSKTKRKKPPQIADGV